jgi:hypothetical protein
MSSSISGCWLVVTWAVVQRDGGEGGDQAGAAEELGDEDGGVGLRLRAVDPLDAGPEHAGVAAALAQHAAAVAAHLTASFTFVLIFSTPSAPPPSSAQPSGGATPPCAR